MHAARVASAVLMMYAWAPAASGGQINFYWNDCLGDGSAENKTIDCTASNDIVEAIGSFILSSPMPDFVAVEVVAEVCANNTTSPPRWWTFDPAAGACHDGSLSMTFDFSSLANHRCTDPFDASVVGGLANYVVHDRYARIIGVGAVDASNARALEPGVEYYGFRLALKLDKATGADSCAGCSIPAVIGLISINAVGRAGSQELSTYAANSQIAAWNGGNYQECYGDAAQNRTWGQVKSLYR